MNFGIMFLVWGLLYIPDGPVISYRNSFIVGILFACSVLCQQFYLFIPVALVVNNLVYHSKYLRSSIEHVKRMMISSILIMAPLILPGILFFKWGGLTHPNFRIHSVSFQPSVLVAILSVAGFYSLPFLVQIIRNLSMRSVLLLLAVAIPSGYFLLPGFNDRQGPGLFTGISFHLFYLTGQVWKYFPVILVILFTWLGLMVAYYLIRTSGTFMDKYLLTCCLFLFVTYSFNTLIGERHLLPLMVILFLMVIPRLKDRFAKPYIISMFILGSSYFIYWNYFKFGIAN